MNNCSAKQHSTFLELCPKVKNYIIGAGIILIKIWIESSDKEQGRYFEARIANPLHQRQLSPMDLPSPTKWFEYLRAGDMMLAAADTKQCPWYILPSDDKNAKR